MRSSSGDPARGRVAWLVAAALALGALALVFWRLAGASARAPETRGATAEVPREAPLETPLATPSSRPAEPAPVPLGSSDAQRSAVPAQGTAPLGKGRLRVAVIGPEASASEHEPVPAFEGPVGVRVRRVEGGFERELALSPASPSSVLQCPAGEYELELARAAGALGAHSARAVLADGSEASVTLALVPLRALTGRLREPSGRAPAGVPLRLERRGRVAAEAVSDLDGRFVFASLPSGAYELVVGDPLGPIVQRRLIELAQWSGEMPLALPALLELELIVLDAAGRPVRGAEVTGLGDSGGRIAGRSGAEGRLRAARLPPGTYRVHGAHAEAGAGEVVLELVEGVGPCVLRLALDGED